MRETLREIFVELGCRIDLGHSVGHAPGSETYWLWEAVAQLMNQKVCEGNLREFRERTGRVGGPMPESCWRAIQFRWEGPLWALALAGDVLDGREVFELALERVSLNDGCRVVPHVVWNDPEPFWG